MNKPRCASDPRPNNEPYYIDKNCKCGEKLVPENEEWHDEFICPKCKGGLHMDWPPTMINRFANAVSNGLI